MAALLARFRWCARAGGASVSEMATDIHTLVQNADDLDRLLATRIDYEMGPAGEA